MSKSVNKQMSNLPIQAEVKRLPYFVGQLVMRLSSKKDAKATGPFKVVSTYKLGRGMRYRIQDIDGIRASGVTPGQIRVMTSEEENAFHKKTSYKHLELCF